MSARGYIITASYLVKNAERIVVEFGNGTKQEAKVERMLPEDRGALLKIEAPETLASVACIGDSRDINDGEWLFAIGHRVGPHYSVSTGILSAKTPEFLQTDAPVATGDAGGPWFNLRGKVVGMTYGLFEREPTAHISFAAPVNALRDVLDERLRTDPTDHGCSGP